jgi:hypothetical protein
MRSLAGSSYYPLSSPLLAHLITPSHLPCRLFSSLPLISVALSEILIKYHSLRVSDLVSKWLLQTKLHLKFKKRYLLSSNIHRYQKLKDHTRARRLSQSSQFGRTSNFPSQNWTRLKTRFEIFTRKTSFSAWPTLL